VKLAKSNILCNLRENREKGDRAVNICYRYLLVSIFELRDNLYLFPGKREYRLVTEELIRSVKIGKRCGRQSFTTESGTLSYQGALLSGIAIMTSRTSGQETS
jgi:hypothetical protein